LATNSASCSAGTASSASTSRSVTAVGCLAVKAPEAGPACTTSPPGASPAAPEGLPRARPPPAGSSSRVIWSRRKRRFGDSGDVSRGKASPSQSGTTSK